MMDQVHSSAPQASGPAGGSNAGAAPTDRELLELAAKAAGVDGSFVMRWDDTPGILSADEDDFWCPLDNDGDALRLAVKLGIDIEFMNDYVYTQEPSSSGRPSWGTREGYVGDAYAATRRAIVRAAAALASPLPDQHSISGEKR